MTQYHVTGMSCAACSARVEKAVSGVAGVRQCAVSLLTNSMGVEGTASPEAVIAAVTAAGYGASLKTENGRETAPAADALTDTETPKLRRRLAVSVILLLLLMYISMGHAMFGLPLPRILEVNPEAAGLAELLLSGAVLTVNQRFFVSGFRGLLHRAPNMHTLVAMGSGVSFVWSICVLFRMTVADRIAAHALLHELNFESAAMILTLITVGKLLEARAKEKTTDALRGLMSLSPKTALILENGAEREVPVTAVRPGTCFAVRPGMVFPADGIVESGSGAVDESALTGESIPADKEAGSAVHAGTRNLSGYLVCRATETGDYTTLSQIIRMVGDAAATKAPIAKTADRVAGVFVPAVIGIALLTLTVWLLIGQSFGYALARAVSVLVISCPCALGLATPVAIMVGSGVGAKHGILFKTASALEETGRCSVIALDKTGTMTAGTPRITDRIPAEGITEHELLCAAAAAEQHSEHPLASAVMEFAAERGISPDPVTEFAAESGIGVRALRNGVLLRGGSAAAMADLLTEDMKNAADALAEQGKTPLCFAAGGKTLGILAAADTLRPDSKAAVRRLRELGLKTVMLTGDNPRTAEAVGREAGVDAVMAGLLPGGKEEAVRALSRDGKVLMIGDGINDAPALTRAEIGLAVGGGTQIAADAADAVLMRSSLTDAVNAVRLSRAALRNIKQNLFWAFCYNIIGIPLAAGVLSPFGITLPPMFGAAAMSLSSFLVVSNALRLNLFKAEAPAASADAPDITNQNTKGTVDQMTITTIEIRGMMCPHCEAHVRKALEAVGNLTVREVSHEKNCAVLESAAAPDEAALRKAVTDAGYEVAGIRR
ncbi:MAG: heavy metal translocating P-type ATPase [Oscillospiraceae bacterium]|nr:heavy metal translocating P-type ATPase [Oscillospiraceae bacterium]